MTERKLVTPFFLGMLIVIPVFFIMTGSGLRLAPRYSAESHSAIVIPASFLMVSATTLFMYLGPRSEKFKLYDYDFCIFLFVMLTSLSLIAGLFFNERQNFAKSFLSYVQTLGPLIGFVLARLLLSCELRDHEHESKTCERKLGSFYLGLSYTTVIVLLLYIIQTRIDGGSQFRFSSITDHFGPFYNYKMKRFFPTVLVVASICILSFTIFGYARLWHRALAFLGYLACVGSTLLMWSRTALVMLFLAHCVVLVFPFLGGSLRRQKAVFLYLLVTVLFAIVLAPRLTSEDVAVSFSRLAGTLNVVTGADRLDESDTKRFDRIELGVVKGIGKPLGDMYEIYDRDRVLTTESGFVDIAIRSGPVGLSCIFILCIMYAARAVHCSIRLINQRTCDEIYWIYPAHSACLISVVIGGNIWLNLTTEPYFGPLFWFLLGATAPITLSVSLQNRRSGSPSPGFHRGMSPSGRISRGAIENSGQVLSLDRGCCSN